MGRALSRDVKTVIFKVAEYFKKRKADRESFEYKSDANIANIVAEATGYCEKTVRNVMKAGISSAENLGRLKFNAPKKPKVIKKRHVVDDIDLGVIRRKIYQFYEYEKRVPSVRYLLTTLKQEGILNCGREFLRNLLHTMGYRFQKCKLKRHVLIEQPNITVLRKKYLTQIRNYRAQNRNIYFLDETFINASQEVSKGQRLVILHAGCRTGLVDEALTILKSDAKTADCQADMNESIFYKWVDEKLKDKLLPNSVVVMDNASYHSVQVDKKPNIASLKTEIQNWLRRQNVEFSENMTKAELLLLINDTQKEPVYRIDELLKAHGHTVMRLPVYHPDLNPIELLWADIKNNIAQNNINYSLDEKIDLLNKLFSEFTVEKWQGFYDHVQKIENNYWDCDSRFDNIIEPIIINLQNDSDSSSDGESEDEEESMSE
ncbi:uncharacterized protein [Battus philenor]|uniref:uncharacterized protein n=1 Tax=Battus philenor TaxID=42288 RepID=UPI0035CEDE23